MKCFGKIVLAGDLNNDLLDPNKDISNILSDLLDVFNLQNLVKEPTCFMYDKGFLIDIIPTNKPRSFHKTQGFFTGISDFHKLFRIVLRSYYKKLPPNNILCRAFKRFAKTTFLRDLHSSLIEVSSITIAENLVRKNTNVFGSTRQACSCKIESNKR